MVQNTWLPPAWDEQGAHAVSGGAIGSVSAVSEFHRLFEDALGAWRDAAQATARFATAIAELAPLLEVGDDAEAAALADAMLHVSVGNQRHQMQMWVVLQNVALYDDELTDAMVELLRREVHPET